MAGVNTYCFFTLITIISQSFCITDINIEDTCETLPSEIHLIKGDELFGETKTAIIYFFRGIR